MNTLEPWVEDNDWVAAAGLIPKINLKESSKPWGEYCQITARNDVEAVTLWLREHEHNSNTYAAYRREALRFLFWCGYQQGKALAALKKEDIERYLLFLRSPPKNWCGKETAQYSEKTWRPFRGELSLSAFMTAVRILNSLFNYLVDAEYLRANPIKLIKKYKKFALDGAERKEEIQKRILHREEWQAIQAVLAAMPEGNEFEVDNKMRTQFLFALLYFLGLRIHEVVNRTWGHFKQRENGQWWVTVRGKGNKIRQVAVNHQLLEFVKHYRAYLEKPLLPSADENESLFVSWRTQRPLKITRLYGLVKIVALEASKAFPEGSLQQRKLQKCSPHWLRHLSGTHQGKLGFSITSMMANFGHANRETTQLYQHAEDDERFDEMQKMQMQITPKIIEKKVIGIEYQLQLSKGPVDKAAGLLRVLAGIATIFKGFEWARIGDTDTTLLERVKTASRQGESITLNYQVKAPEVVKAAEMWANALKRQCEIWLFDCELAIQELAL